MKNWPKKWLCIMMIPLLTGCIKAILPSTSAPFPMGVIFYSEQEGKGALYFWEWKTSAISQVSLPEQRISFFSAEADWSGAAKQLAYTCGYPEGLEICTRDFKGAYQRLTWNLWEDTMPRWSPNGHWIAFLSRHEDGALRAYVMDSKGQEVRLAISDPDILAGWIAWSPNGKYLAVVGQRRSGIPPFTEAFTSIYIIDPFLGEIVKEFSGNGNYGGPVWSPDGKQIAYTLYREGEYNVFIHDLETGQDHQVVSGAMVKGWSPDGHWLALLSERSGEGLTDINSLFFKPSFYRLLVIHPDGSSKRDLTPTYAQSIVIEPGMWSPDSRYILATVYEVEPEPRVNVALIETANGNVRKITNNRLVNIGLCWVY